MQVTSLQAEKNNDPTKRHLHLYRRADICADIYAVMDTDNQHIVSHIART
eukprot:m.54739 g.54739  ORF g.54739 m.54739 type:complete len:50 (+) comp11444_c0_seq1:203-352(+)